jgi:monooxygenase
MSITTVDILIVGAGISGIGAACHLRRECPGKTFAILERRQAIGGTWDLFRYPGIRSDSDMYSFGYHFRPWTEPKVLADGPSIRAYVTDTAREYDVERHIRFGLKVLSADWDSRSQRWTVEALDETSGETSRYQARFLLGCTGYYNYDAGYRPRFPGEEAFKGQIVHPQHWPEGLDYAGKQVVVIGSGATAITLVPSMAADAAKVTMLQRSPTYILSVPAVDAIAAGLQKWLPSGLAYRLNRGRNITVNRLLYRMARARPKAVRRLLLGLVKRQIGDTVDMRHFTPDYMPWDQRLCVVPNGDLFKALRAGKAAMATDHIETFTETGIRLKSGEELPADIVVSATGLDVQLLGGIQVRVDGEPLAVKDRLTYKGVLVEGVPNAAIVFGYTNISWTLKADIAAEYVCRLLKHMDRKGYAEVIPRDPGDHRTEDTILGSLASGYIRRAADRLPRQGSTAPWQITQDYVRDAPVLRYGSIEDEALEFRPPLAAASASTPSRKLKAA